MLRIKPLFILCAALLTVTPAASADVNSDMNQFFNKLGFASNTTQPGVWQGQAAGYAYGGSLYDILLQYIQELIQQARAMVATGNYDEAVIGHINDNMNDATRQIAAFQSQVQVQQDALLVVDRQMSYMRQQLSARMLSRYQNNYHFGGSTL
nr:conjugal transfer protein TraH [Escherichia coli]